MAAKRLLYARADGKWAWHLEVNGRIVATDGSQGYDNQGECRAMADRIIGGTFHDAERKILWPQS